MLSFQQIERIIEHALPSSAYNHAAFWSNSSKYSRAWRDAGREVSRRNLLPETIRFTQTHDGSEQATETTGAPALYVVPELFTLQPADVQDADPGGSAQCIGVLLLGCVRGNPGVPRKAEDLHASDLFGMRRRYANQRGLQWFVLSAEHGLLRQDEWVAPHNVELNAQPESYREAWGGWVIQRLCRELGTLSGIRLEVHAADSYADALAEPARAAGASVTRPLLGLPESEQLAWYLAQPASPGDCPSA